MVTSHSLAGQLVLSPDVSTGAAWSTGHSANRSYGSRGPTTSGVLPSGEGSLFGWSGKLGEPLREDVTEFHLRGGSTDVLAKGGRVTWFVMFLTLWFCPSLVPRSLSGENEWVTGPSPPRLDITTLSVTDLILFPANGQSSCVGS